MKQVLVIDAPPLFSGFLKDKLNTEKIKVGFAEIKKDAFPKMLSALPDLIIIDIEEAHDDFYDFLTKKRNDPNANKIPIIITGPTMERELVSSLSQFNVIKYFHKPIKFDIFFKAVAKSLMTTFAFDSTLCTMEMHVNNNIIFIEIAHGLNREKLSILKYRLTEIIDLTHITTPKVVLMMSDLTLSFVDGSNLELLLDNILADERVQPKNLKIITEDTFTKDLVMGHFQYSGVQVATNLPGILNSIIDKTASTNLAEIIAEKVLASTDDMNQGLVQLSFHSDTSQEEAEDDSGLATTIAIVEDDSVTRTLIENAFSSINAQISCFASGNEFLTSTNKTEYDLIILDVNLPGISGFDVLRILQNKQYFSPSIVYSSEKTREAIMQALSLGAKTYLVKPLKPEVLLQKAIEVLRSKDTM
jgi:DNA-binding response OmpR family regulator